MPIPIQIFTSTRIANSGLRKSERLGTCSRSSRLSRPTTARRKANARLIAAAPDLLAVAIEAENWFDNHGQEDDEGAMDLLKVFRAAIARAEGR